MLQKVSIQNFKSLKDVTLELQRVNLLIGPNNSGKSNFLKALESFKLLIDDYSKYFHQVDPSSDLSIHKISNIDSIIRKNDFFLKAKAERMVFDFRILNGYTYSTFFEISNEFYLNIGNNGKSISSGEAVCLINRDFETDAIIDEEDDILIDDDYICGYFKKIFNDIEIYKPDPNKLQKSFPILPNQSHVSNDASNLIAFLDTLRDEYPENFKVIENDLNKCIPELTGLRFENVEIQKNDDLYKIYGDKTFKRLGLFDANNKVTYWADELSEGTLYFLALLCIVHQPNPPKLLLLEEPEKGIHPRRIREVMDFIFQLAEDKDIQIIMTTHSERVLDEFEDIPEAVFVFDKDEEGATQVKNLLKDIIEPSNEKMDANDLPRIKFVESLGSHWVTGFIGGVPR
ncbi:AAA family ATPase [Arcicella sp. LKC2W]|uniref:AAA family ATPase n=1 Tax=Arcicella sp. LKC2W TaxID=2984198 RepID=UPI002B208923|nr:AAA family ATPase [Arcicella sp. LKC2W]MEA5458938.1 AAA family ATPase [Arcicella sp. LKC2W]